MSLLIHGAYTCFSNVAHQPTIMHHLIVHTHYHDSLQIIYLEVILWSLLSHLKYIYKQGFGDSPGRDVDFSVSYLCSVKYKKLIHVFLLPQRSHILQHSCVVSVKHMHQHEHIILLGSCYPPHLILLKSLN